MRRCCLLLAVVAGTTIGIACASTPPKVASLSLSSSGSLTPAPGKAVTLSVRAVMDDGTSIDVTGSAVCTLDAKDPPGTLQGNIFTATKFGFTNVVCTFSGVTVALGITVPAPLKIPITDIQKGVLPQGAEVLVDAVVFGLEKDGIYTNFWAQDPGGGPYSGIHFRDARTPPAGDGGTLAPPAAEGDTVLVHGKYAERSGHSDVSFDTVTVTGTAAPVAAPLRTGEVDAAIWDGCLIAVTNVTVVNPAFDSYTWQIADAMDPSNTLLVETLLYSAAPAAGQRFASINGPLYVLQPKNGGALEVAVAPRRAGDLVP